MDFIKYWATIVAWAILIDIVLIVLFGARVSSYFEKKVNQMNENVAKNKNKTTNWFRLNRAWSTESLFD